MSTRTPEWANEPDYEYVAYIDEAGDPGIERVRPIDPAGSTEWFVLAAVVIRKSREAEVVGFIRDLLQELKIRGRTNLHFRSMSESKKLRACERLAKFNARLFVVASNKKNMRKHRNKNAEKTSGEIRACRHLRIRKSAEV